LKSDDNIIVTHQHVASQDGN